MRPKRCIAILFHENYRFRSTRNYILHYLADYWREWGFSVHHIYGVQHFSPADLLFVHVDLSVVPDEYLEFASKYRATVNLGVSDIRKSIISTNIVTQDDGWQGPVIVKSDLNYGGAQELTRRRSKVRSKSIFEAWWPIIRKLRSRINWLRGTANPIGSVSDYKIYDGLSLVPPSRVADQRLVIEKFLPEFENGLYFLRVYEFLGDRWICLRMASRSPIVKAGNCVSIEQIEPHQKIIEWRKSLNMDYGKLDYVMSDGQPVLLDANKTIGASISRVVKLLSSEKVEANWYELAEGIHYFF